MNNIKFSLIFIILNLINTFSYSESNKYHLGDATAKYITAYDLLAQLKNSKCNYLIKQKIQHYNLFKQETLGTLKSNLSNKEYEELNNLFDTQYQRLHEANQKNIKLIFEKYKSEGKNDETSCELISNSIFTYIENSKNNWLTLTK